MPTQQDATHDPAPSDTGFAALEAKVDEVQREAEASTQTGGFADVSAISLSGTIHASPTATAGLTSAPWIAAYADCMQDGLRLQVEAFERFIQVRGPQDLVAAQQSYATRTFEFYMASMARVAGAGFPRLGA